MVTGTLEDATTAIPTALPKADVRVDDDGDLLAALRRRSSSGAALPKEPRYTYTAPPPPAAEEVSEVDEELGNSGDPLTKWLEDVLTDHGIEDLDAIGGVREFAEVEAQLDKYHRALAEVSEDVDIDAVEGNEVSIDGGGIAAPAFVSEPETSWGQFLADNRLEDCI